MSFFVSSTLYYGRGITQIQYLALKNHVNWKRYEEYVNKRYSPFIMVCNPCEPYPNMIRQLSSAVSYASSGDFARGYLSLSSVPERFRDAENPIACEPDNIMLEIQSILNEFPSHDDSYRLWLMDAKWRSNMILSSAAYTPPFSFHRRLPVVDITINDPIEKGLKRHQMLFEEMKNRPQPSWYSTFSASNEDENTWPA